MLCLSTPVVTALREAVLLHPRNSKVPRGLESPGNKDVAVGTVTAAPALMVTQL